MKEEDDKGIANLVINILNENIFSQNEKNGENARKSKKTPLWRNIALEFKKILREKEIFFEKNMEIQKKEKIKLVEEMESQLRENSNLKENIASFENVKSALNNNTQALQYKEKV